MLPRALDPSRLDTTMRIESLIPSFLDHMLQLRDGIVAIDIAANAGAVPVAVAGGATTSTPRLRSHHSQQHLNIAIGAEVISLARKLRDLDSRLMAQISHLELISTMPAIVLLLL